MIIILTDLIKKARFFIGVLVILILAFVFEPFVMNTITRLSDLRLFAWSLISWYSFKYFLMGILFSIPFIVLSYLLSRVLALIVILETKIRFSKIIYINKSFEISLFSYLEFSYLLYGLIPMLIRIFSVFPANKDVVTLYVTIVFSVIIYAPYIIPLMAAIVLPLAWIREKSQIRRLKGNFCLGYPGTIIDAFFLLFIGVGSITALAPMYFELLNISGNPLFSLELFIYIILLGYCPSLTFVLGVCIGIMVLGKRFIIKATKKFENIVTKYIKPAKIMLEL